MIFNKEELSKIFNTTVTSNVVDISTDSRAVKPGDLFIALKGEHVDGHEYVRSALANGAALAIVEQDIKDDRVIKVPSTYQALLDLAHYNINASNAKYIGVTGSIGKTTTKDLIYHILSQFIPNEVYVTRKNFNSQIGLPICAACMPRDTSVGIFEMGMSHPGEITSLINIVSPMVSVITYIGETHLEFFNCMWDIAKAKSEIMISSQKATIVPADSAYTEFLKNKAKKLGIPNILSFGWSKSEAQLISCDCKQDHTTVVADILGKRINYDVTCHNDSVVLNSLSSLLASHLMIGTDVQELADKISLFKPSSHRGEVVHHQGITIVDDCYNACYSSVRSAIQSLSKYTGRKILIFGDMKELGVHGQYFHENLAATVDKFGVDLVFACGDLAKYLFNNISHSKQGVWCENSEQLAKIIKDYVQPGDNILIKGSNSMRMNVIVEAICNDL